MKKVIFEIPEINYVLIHWKENTITPWVAAWVYDKETGNWAQGHYFREKKDALEYLANTYKERYSTRQRIAEILSA